MAKQMGVFTKEELHILLSSLVEKATPKVAYKFIQWCERARINNVILERTLAGQLLTKVGPDGEPSYGGEREPQAGPALEPVNPQRPIKADITNQEYRLLLNMLQIADWILHAHIFTPPDDEYTALIQKFMVMANDYGCGDLVKYYEEKKAYCPTNEHLWSDEVQGPIGEHDDEVFWDKLAGRLAKRDVIREIGLKEYAKLDRSQRYDRLMKAQKRYDDEFVANGLKRLELPETGKRKKPGGKPKTS